MYYVIHVRFVHALVKYNLHSILLLVDELQSNRKKILYLYLRNFYEQEFS